MDILGIYDKIRVLMNCFRISLVIWHKNKIKKGMANKLFGINFPQCFFVCDFRITECGIE